MGILRSERMQHGTLVIPVDRAVEIITLLGTKGNLQIQDMNHATMRRPYRRYIQRIEEMERMLRYLTDEIYKLPGARIESKHYQDFLENDNFLLDGVEDSLQSLYAQFVRFRENNDDLLKQRNRALMEKAVARVAVKSLRNTRMPTSMTLDGPTHTASQALLQGDAEAAPTVTGFSSFAGVVLQSDQEKLARTLFRATRGNAYTHIEDLDEGTFKDESGNVVQRNVFVIYYQGGVGSAMHEKISRICQAFGIEVFDWPKSAQAAAEKLKVLQEIIDDKTRALEAFEEFFFDEVAVLLEPVRPGGNSLIEDWRMFCQKQKAVFGCLNLFEETEATLRAECWYPAEEEELTRQLLSSFSGPNQVSAFLLSDREVTRRNPPTYIKTTAFTECFQNVVDTYGVPRYQEANPALLTIITFPFLFGVMYGDIGHGGLVMLFGLYLCLAYKKLSQVDEEMTQMIVYGRYMIFMMGCFAVFAGFIYNDFFSLGVDLLGSRYRETSEAGVYEKDPEKRFPYPFGFDPVWKGASNELDFFNSFKMKFAVIVAFVQMGAGVVLKALNALHFKDHLTFYFEFIPQILFLIALIGYMDFLIIFKWGAEYHGQPRPSLISTIIGMCMLKDVEPEDQLFANQKTIQMVLVALMVICIPWMLIPKPLLLLAAHKKQLSAKGDLANVSNEEIVPLGAAAGEDTAQQKPSGESSMVEAEEEFEFGEIMIHQMIETIEYVLGVISNTASYLRLWALSLAHQQLALVFFENILLIIIEATVKPDGSVIVPAIGIFIGFGIFAAVTFAIMLCMDSLECFLHALRLQWVEFQNKFYAADGYKFIPFSFFRILSGADTE